jgi:hypothetical protein
VIQAYDNVKFGDSQPLTELIEQLTNEKKSDQIRGYSGLSVDENCKLVEGGATFTKRGFTSLCRLTSMPPVMVEWLARNDYKPELSRFINSELAGLAFDDDQAGRPRKRVFARFREDNEGNQFCRALFSDRYAPVDANVLIAMVADALTSEELEQARIHRLSYDGDELLCNLVWPGCDREVGGDAYQVGVAIQTSEIGTLRMQIQPWIGRLRCANGLIVNAAIGSGISKRHVGKIDMNELAASIRQSVGSALAQADRALMQLEAGRRVKVEKADKVIVQLGREHRLTNDQIKHWLVGHDLTLREESFGNESVFSVINGLTASARFVDLPATERTYLEELAGKLVAPRFDALYEEIESDWRGIEVRANMLADEVVAGYRY